MARGYKIADGYLDITADHSKADREIGKFFRDTNGRLHDEQGRFVKEGERSGLGFAQGLTRGADHESRSGFRGLAAKWGRTFASAGMGVGRLFANKFVAAAIAGLGALPQAIGVLSSAIGGAINIAGAGAALAPAAIGALALTMLSLKTAFSGLGDALKAGLSGDMAKFAEATKNLAPAMQQAVREMVKLNPLIKELKQAVQQNFWSRFVADITPLATTYLPMIEKSMANIAAGFGVAIHNIAAFLGQGSTAQAMALAFDNIGEAVRNIASMLPGLVKTFLILFQVGATFLPGLTSNLAGIADHLAEITARAAADGSLAAFIQRGLDLARQLGAILGDVLGILQSIGNAAPGEGGLLGALGQLLDMVNRFFQSMEGQAILTSFFEKLTALGTLVMGLVQGALPGLLTLSGALLQALTMLAPIAPVVGKAIGDALTALAPILPILGQVLTILLTMASGLLSALAAELGPMISLWSELAMQILPMLLPVINQLISTALPVMVQLGKAFADAWAPLIPVLVQIVEQLINGLLPYLPQLQEIGMQLAPVFADVAKQLGGAFLDAINRIVPFIPDMIKVLLVLLTVLVKVGGPYLAKAITLFGFLATVFITVGSWAGWLVLHIFRLPGAIIGLATSIWNFVKGAGQAIGDWISSAVSWFASLPGKIWGAVQQIPTLIKTALSSAVYEFGYKIGLLVGFAISLPGRIWSALQSLWGVITNAVSSAWNSAVSWTSNKITEIVAWARGLPERVKNAIINLGGQILNVVTSAWIAAKNGFSTGITNAVNLAKSLPGRIKDALSGAASWLYGVGQDAVRGLANGLMSMLGWVKGKASELAHGILDGAKKGLGIGSPSKLFRDEVGKWIPPGIQMGIEAQMPKLNRYVEGTMAALAARPQNINVSAPSISIPATAAPILLVDGEQIATKIATPDRIAKANVEGARRRAYLNTGRTAMA